MLKKYTLALGFALIVLGILNFFVVGFETSIIHAALHIAAGVLGIALTFRAHTLPYIKWTTLVLLILATLGFAGVKNILGILEFDIFVKWVYLVLGLLSVWIYLTVKQKNREIHSQI